MHATSRSWILKAATLMVLGVAIGCGGPDSDNSTAGSGEATSGGDAAAGSSMSLPDEDEPAVGSGSKPSGSGTIELPDELPPAGETQPSSAAEGGSFELPDIDQSSESKGAVELKYATWSDISQRARSTGKITVVDLWSTMCAPCIKEFPGLVQLDKTIGEKVTCIGVDVDFDGRKKYPPESYETKVQAFLTSVDARFENYICQTPSDDVFQEAGLPSIPAVLVFNAEGELVKQFIDAGDTLGFTYEKDVIPLVHSIL
ncbi:MAG: TlpA disulfide reductase family protein [Planctomycetota bacterium]